MNESGFMDWWMNGWMVPISIDPMIQQSTKPIIQ